MNDHPAADRAELLRWARSCIDIFVHTGQQPSYQTDNPWFLTPAAVFVTLRSRDAHDPYEPDEEPLRGCVGQIEPRAPLYLAVADAAIQAATADPRFQPVEPHEVDGLRIEISVLSPMRPIERLENIHIGPDGLLIAGQRRRGLLLPEVASRYGWDAATFVNQLCWKAGLPPDTWPDRAQLWAFTTEAFEEG